MWKMDQADLVDLQEVQQKQSDRHREYKPLYGTQESREDFDRHSCIGSYSLFCRHTYGALEHGKVGWQPH